MKQMIFIVEDDTALQELYQYSLENEFDCRCFENGDLFLDAVAKRKIPDLILLDIMLPGDDGFKILSFIKQNKTTADVPVIMVSAKGDEVSKVKGLNMGANDYIAKPFSVLELVARIKANLRKSGKETESVNYKDIIIDHAKHQITANGVILQTTLKEYNLLRMLCKNPEKVQVRDAIFNEVWDSSFGGETRTLDMHIRELRKKLAESCSEAVIQTVRGVGYMII